jgi:hypothetical protein
LLLIRDVLWLLLLLLLVLRMTAVSAGLGALSLIVGVGRI